MKRVTITISAALLLLCLVVPGARADFGLHDFDITFSEADGSPALLAGGHPYEMVTSFDLNTYEEEGTLLPDESPKDIFVFVPPGFFPTPNATPRCSSVEFAEIDTEAVLPGCSNSTVVGTIDVKLAGGNGFTHHLVPLYNLAPSPGSALKLGFVVENVPVTIEGGLAEYFPYNGVARSTGITQTLSFFGAEVTLWGNPSDKSHDPYRGSCLDQSGGAKLLSKGNCPVSIGNKAFLTMPPACTGPLLSSYEAASWQHPDDWVSGIAETHDTSEPPSPLGTYGCSKLAFNPTITAKPTTKAAESPSGLDFSLDVQDEGLLNPEGQAHADIEKAVVTLPDGFTTNPSIAEGLVVCSEDQLEAETAFSLPGAGCPEASKIGTVEVETPIVDENVNGSLYIAKPYENQADDSLLALYLVVKNPNLGVIVKQPLKVQLDQRTGRITTIAEDIPQLPFSHFRLHFREGTRSPLASPPGCGTYDAKAELTPSSGAAPITTTSAFQIITGPSSGPCPSGGLPPFRPGLIAGTLNNAAGSFSPFNVRLSRSDGEQEFTHFSIKLPPGVAGKLAGIPFCSDAQIARAEGRTGPHGGQEELGEPSCPAASAVGRTLAGAGVGPSLAYAPGKIYLAGPYHGSPISFVSITSGVVGPFDIGTVVVRLAIEVNPETGEVFLDSTGSDPIPHIVKGIPVHLRDIRAYTDRPEFTFNPTSCARKSTAATVLGSGLDFASGADDNPFVSTSPFQAADCAALPFAPKLTLKLLGGTKRGDFPKLKAFLKMNGFGEAGVARAQVTLPKSEFIANAHFDTICTRVQFKAAGGNGEACPAGSIYGWARAKTPVLAEPLEGPVFLRSSEHELPDVVASLRGQQINVHLVGHVDSVKGKLRNTFETVPDAPVEWASFSFKGGDKGLFENSTNLCVGKHRADVRFSGQNGKRSNYRPAVKVKCGKKRKHGNPRAARPKRAGR